MEIRMHYAKKNVSQANLSGGICYLMNGLYEPPLLRTSNLHSPEPCIQIVNLSAGDDLSLPLSLNAMSIYLAFATWLKYSR